MSVRFKCPGCGKSVKVSVAMAGKRGKCPGCDKTLKIPSAEQLQKLEAQLSAASGVAPATPPSAGPDSAGPDLAGSDSSGLDDPFGELPANDWDDDDFDFSKPAPEAEQEANPYASPLTEYKRELGASSRKGGGYAGLWLRFAAAFCDGIILSLIGRAIATIINLMMKTGEGDGNAALMYLAAIVLIQWLYYALQECSASQATFGKRAVGIKVTDLNGHPISFGRATLRYFGKIVSYMTVMVGFIMIAFTGKKQGLHDMIAGTLVVKA